MDVGFAIQQHEDGDVRDAMVGVIESEIHGDGHATHRADLQVEHHDVGAALGDESAHLAALAADGERHVGCAERGGDVVDDVIGIGGDGHCLSVFPGSPLAAPDAPISAAVAAPTHIEPHLPRLTFSLKILAAARSVLSLAAGAAKADVLARIIDGGESISTLPAKAALLPTATWLIDTAAASKLTER